MRLIDADKIVNYRVTADDGKKYVLLPVEKLDDIPTAYDVDKVVGGVNEALDRLFNFCEEIDLNLPEDERTGYKMLNDIWAIRDIVERGGVI